jgi:lipoyl(octanoyl) transferase
MTITKPLNLRDLGIQPYSETWDAMRAFTEARTPETADELWLVEHPPVFTQGQAGKAEHIINPGDIPVVQSDRGGQVTYHGPGQLVVYCLIDLKRTHLGIRDLVTALEQAVIHMLADQGVRAEARPDAPGIYIDKMKICSIGLRVKKGCSYHGLALNVCMDLSPFQHINPCGYNDLKMTQLCDHTSINTVAAASELLVPHLLEQLGYNR